MDFCRPTARPMIMPFSSQFHKFSGVILCFCIRLCNVRYHMRCSSIDAVTFARILSRYWQYLNLILGCRARNRVNQCTPGGVIFVPGLRARRIAQAIETRIVTGKKRSLILPHQSAIASSSPLVRGCCVRRATDRETPPMTPQA